MASRRTAQLICAARQPRLYLFTRSEQCSSRYGHARRPFSSGQPRQAAASKRGAAAPAQRSAAVLQRQTQKQMMDSGRIFEEYGVLPETFVTQRASERPKDLKERWEWEKARLFARLKTAYQFCAIKLFMVHVHDPDTAATLSRWKRLTTTWDFEVLSAPKIAEALYKDMYTALAAGDIETLQRKVRRDMLDNLSGRILERGPGTESQWRLDKFLHRPRLVAYQIALLDPNRPRWRQSFMQQAVVEMDSEQTLTTRKKGSATPGKVDTRRVREYLVLQKDVVDGRAATDWRIWGTTRPTTLADVRKAALA